MQNREAKPYDRHASEKEGGKRKRKKALLFIPVMLGAGAVSLLFAFSIMPWLFEADKNEWFDTDAQVGSYPGKTEEEIIADLDRIVEDGMFNISISSQIFFADGASEGVARIENIANNKRNMRVEISLDETEEIVYSSKGIRPGEYVDTITLARNLPAGRYEATATFLLFDTDSLEQTGCAAAKVMLIVAT